jgi:hypothetical protein
MPAPPPESLPAIVRATGTLLESKGLTVLFAFLAAAFPAAAPGSH